MEGGWTSLSAAALFMEIGFVLILDAVRQPFADGLGSAYWINSEAARDPVGKLPGVFDAGAAHDINCEATLEQVHGFRSSPGRFRAARVSKRLPHGISENALA